MTIQNATLDDIEGIIAVHVSTFPNFFLTNLGASFLRTYYRAFILSEHGCVLCAKNEHDKVVAFCVTSYVSHGFNVRLGNDNLSRFVSIGTKLLLTHPKYRATAQ